MLGVAFALHLLGYDLWFYASHLALHTRWGWPLHARHHEKREPQWRDTYHAHWLEGPLQSLGFALPWLLGLWAPWEAGAALLLAQARGLARHETRLGWLIGRHHLIHHEKMRWNFGEPWLDWVGGTFWSGDADHSDTQARDADAAPQRSARRLVNAADTSSASRATPRP
jgi:sterol desaturase/sphingolipid hydroxylase (fatty acid hydroxylase superfamily)